jgi:hypothetical protein
MHYHLEIIIPRTDDVESAVANILAPFDENGTDDEDGYRKHSFWDWYVIGGRWAGAKLEAKLGDMAPFYDELKKRNVTVAGLQCGKQTLQPASQIPLVDAMWREMFPESGLDVCPLFDHSPSVIVGDICTLKEMPERLSASRVIIAGPSYDDPDKFKAVHMIEGSVWNGVSHVDTTWDGNVLNAVNAWRERIAGYADEYQSKNTPTDEWITVTVDYHS